MGNSDEDDFPKAQGAVQRANAQMSDAQGVLNDLNDKEREKLQAVAPSVSQLIIYLDTYSRLALMFERGVNGSNRAIVRARVAQALAASNQNRSYSNSYGNVNCNTYGYNTNCTGSATTTTTYNNAAEVQQRNAANALAAAESGRLSLSEVDGVLTQGLPLLEQISSQTAKAVTSWVSVCS